MIFDLGRESAEATLSLVEEAIAAGGIDRGQAPTLKFHEASGMLIVVGDPRQTALISSVVERVQARESLERAVAEESRAEKLEAQLVRMAEESDFRDSRYAMEKEALAEQFHSRLAELEKELERAKEALARSQAGQ